MTKHPGGIVLTSLQLDRESHVPMFQQLYQAIRQAVLSRGLLPGARLPSTRTLAKELEISRNTVVMAYEQLLSEGYVEGQIGSGSYISRFLPDELLAGRLETEKLQAEPGHEIKYRPKRYLAHAPMKIWKGRGGLPRAFRFGVPALDHFPYSTWNRILNKYWRSEPQALLNYGRIAGYRPLCEALAMYLQIARGVRCEPEQIIIVSGSQQGLDLTCKVLLNPSDTVWMEDPGYHGARAPFLAAGAKIIPVPLDEEGLDVTRAEELSPQARLAFVTPSHQFPLGMTMSLTRRLRLLEWASRVGAWIIEDDYDSEFRYSGRPLAALQGLDHDGRVIYIGTFSKVLFPSLRLGYLVVPPNLVDDFTAARAMSDQHSSLIEQAVVTDLLTEGHFSRHIRNMRALYQERQQAVIKAVDKYLGPRLDVHPDNAGMHLVGWLSKDMNDETVAQEAVTHGVDVLPLSVFGSNPLPRPGLLLGYAAINEAQIQEGIERLGKALK